MAMHQQVKHLDIQHGDLKGPRGLEAHIANSSSTPFGPFGTSIERDVMLGPDDDEIDDCLRKIRSRLFGVANSLVSELRISQNAISKSKSTCLDTFDIVHAVIKIDDPETWLQPEFTDPTENRRKSRQFLQAILATAIMQWAFTGKDVSMNTSDSVLLDCYQEEVKSKRESLYRNSSIIRAVKC